MGISRGLKEREKKTPTLSERAGVLLDKAISVVSPSWSFKRAQFRAATHQLSGAYPGASKQRPRSAWVSSSGSADEDLLPDLADLRERSRDLYRSDPHAVALTETTVINDVGSGIRAQSRVNFDQIRGLGEEQAAQFQNSAEIAFKRWIPFADASDGGDFYDLQSLVDRQILLNGEVFIMPVQLPAAGDPDEDPGRPRPYHLALSTIEADRVDTPQELRGDRDVRAGIRRGIYGEPRSYYVRQQHPGDLTLRKSGKTRWVEIDKHHERTGRAQMMHLYYKKRPGQTRGEPFFAPVLNLFKDLADYMEAELVAARVAACFAVFVKKSDPMAAAAGASSSSDSQGRRVETLSPGIIEYLGPGEDISTFNPQRPGFQFEPFVERLLKAISAALGLPSQLVIKDFGRMNYSSARAALLEAWRYFRFRQDWLARHFCQPVYEMFLDEAWLRGELKEARAFRSNIHHYTRARWIGPGRGWIDPVKEIKAAKEAVSSNLSTLANEAAAQGYDWEENIRQRKREVDTIRKLGVPETTKKVSVTQVVKRGGDGGGGNGGEPGAEEVETKDKVDSESSV